MPVRRQILREFNDQQLCALCFQAVLSSAETLMHSLVIQLDEPDRLCTNCLAMVDPSVSSSWCPILELGNTRAALCQSFTPVTTLELVATTDVPEHDPAEMWALICSELEASLGPSHLDWLARATPATFEDRMLGVEVPDEYTKAWLVSRLMPAILQATESIGYPRVKVQFHVAPADGQHVPSPAPRRKTARATNGATQPVLHVLPPPMSTPAPGPPHAPSGFNPSFSFESFVVGTGNRLAHAGAMAVAEGDSSYNPLFLYGQVGVGKTHLLQAIGGRCARLGRNALYVSSEMFTNELVAAIRSGTTADFRRRYREIEVLLVDDIHFIIGKESTQEEFFHTFNCLYDGGKQIVLSSDRSPNHMQVLDARLRSRFWWGLTADIQSPDLETRVEILRRKAFMRGRTLPDDVLSLLAGRNSNNVRELEGALNRLLALSDLHGVEPSVSLAQTLFQSRSRDRELTHEDILQAVSAYYKIPVSAMSGKRRSRDVSTPRHIAMYLMRHDAGLALPQIGDVLGGRDHSTVIYGCSRIGKGLDGEGPVRRDVEAIRDLLR
jgi:chromosomal replication initiator protein